MRRRSPSVRRTAWRFGLRAEAVAVWLLRLKGYRILARRFASPLGEIDIVAHRSNLLAFVEVKGRRGVDVDLSAISDRQMRRIGRAAEAFVQARPAFTDHDRRFDAVLVGGGGWPRHCLDIWRPEPQ